MFRRSTEHHTPFGSASASHSVADMVMNSTTTSTERNPMTTTKRKPPKPRAKASPITPAEALEDFSLSNDQMLSTSQAAAVTPFSVKTLRQMRCDKTGPRCFKLGTGKQSRVVYRRSDLEKWIRSLVAVVQVS